MCGISKNELFSDQCYFHTVKIWLLSLLQAGCCLCCYYTTLKLSAQQIFYEMGWTFFKSFHRLCPAAHVFLVVVTGFLLPGFAIFGDSHVFCASDIWFVLPVSVGFCEIFWTVIMHAKWEFQLHLHCCVRQDTVNIAVEGSQKWCAGSFNFVHQPVQRQ